MDTIDHIRTAEIPRIKRRFRDTLGAHYDPTKISVEKSTDRINISDPNYYILMAEHFSLDRKVALDSHARFSFELYLPKDSSDRNGTQTKWYIEYTGKTLDLHKALQTD